MKKQKKTQLFLVFLGLFLILATYFYYPSLERKKNLENKFVEEKVEDIANEEENTTFENVKYNGLYDYDKLFTVESEKAHILNEEPDVVYMKKMHVILSLSDGRVVNIYSDHGTFNKATYDCFFEDNVKASDGEINIFAKNLDLISSKNVVEIYNNVNLQHPTGTLNADKIDYSFETKLFKISMFNEDKIKMKVVQK